MRVERATTVLTVSCVLLAGPKVDQQRETSAQTRVLQGCVVQDGTRDSPTAGASAPSVWLDTARHAGQPDDLSMNAVGQSGQRAGQQQLPTGQQTQAGQEPMAAVLEEQESTASQATRYQLVPVDDRLELASHVGRRVEVVGTLSGNVPAHRRHDGRAVPQGAPNTLPDDDRDVATTLTVTSVRVLDGYCTR